MQQVTESLALQWSVAYFHKNFSISPPFADESIITSMKREPNIDVYSFP